MILVFFYWFSASKAQLSCDALNDLAASLDSLDEAIQSVEDIGVNSEPEKAFYTLSG